MTLMPGARVIATFTSKASPVVTNVGLGFLPAIAKFLNDIKNGGTLNEYEYVDSNQLPAWPAVMLLTTGSTGAVTAPDSGLITRYLGGVTLDVDVLAASDYRNDQGVLGVAGDITLQGITIPAAIQVASGVNRIIAWREDLGGI